MLPRDFFAGLAIIALFAVPLGVVLVWVARRCWRHRRPVGEDTWDTDPPPTAISVRGDATERLVAVSVSPLIGIVCAGLYHAGHLLFDSGPLFVEIIYYELIFGALGIAVLAFVWGLLRPRWLEAFLVAVASHVSSTLFFVATIAVVVGVIGLALHAAVRVS